MCRKTDCSTCSIYSKMGTENTFYIKKYDYHLDKDALKVSWAMSLLWWLIYNQAISVYPFFIV